MKTVVLGRVRQNCIVFKSPCYDRVYVLTPASRDLSHGLMILFLLAASRVTEAYVEPVELKL